MPVFIPKVEQKNLPPPITEEHIRYILGKADGNGDGSFTKDELKKAFRELGSYIPAWRAYRCLDKVDTNHDGQIGGAEIDGLVDYVLARFGNKTKK